MLVKPTLRRAIESDIEAISNIALESLPQDPQWPYRFPYAFKYPEDHEKFTRKRYTEHFANQERGTVCIMVAELPSNEDSSIMKLIAFAKWQLPGSYVKLARDKTKPTIKPSSDYLDRPDANLARMRAYRETISKAKEDYFDKKFGDSQLYLTTLATHPHYMRRGAGAALCDWGIKKAVSDKLAAVTLFSSPMGIPLYTKLGFRQVGIVHTQVDGEEDFIDFPGMTLEPRSFVLRSRNLETGQ